MPLTQEWLWKCRHWHHLCAPLLLHRNFHSLAASNKVWMQCVYIVHLRSIDPNPFTSTYQSGGRCNTSWTVTHKWPALVPEMLKHQHLCFSLSVHSKILRLHLMASRVYNRVISSVSHCNNSIFPPNELLELQWFSEPRSCRPSRVKDTLPPSQWDGWSWFPQEPNPLTRNLPPLSQCAYIIVESAPIHVFHTYVISAKYKPPDSRQFPIGFLL